MFNDYQGSVSVSFIKHDLTTKNVLREKFLSLAVIVFVTGFCSCSGSGDTRTNETAAAKPDSTVTTKTEKSGPVSFLMVNTCRMAWINKTGGVKNWAIEDSALVCLGAAKDAHAGDIVSDKEYENFELS